MFSNASSNPIRGKRSKRARSNKPKLPIELESMVLNTFQDLHSPEDLTWLWVGGRHVSKHFRSEIERIFKTIFLPETILRCDLGVHFMCWDVFEPDCSEGYAGCYAHMSTVKHYGHRTPCFTLDRFSDDQTRAFFACEDYYFLGKMVFRRLHEKQLVGAPVFSIQIREVVNDTGLPDLQIDDEKGEVSFDWKGMLDQLMGEEHVFNTILSQRLGWHLDPGEDESNLLEMHRKLARRSRFQRECRAKYRCNILEHYTHNEKPALEMTQALRLAATGLQNTHNDDDDNNKNTKNLAIYTKQQILDELPDDAIIYSGNSNPGKKPGSIPRGIFDDNDLCSPMNRWRKDLPPPSATDLFTPRPLPDLSMGRRRMMDPARSSTKRGHGPSHGKRAREEEDEETGTLANKRGKPATV